MLRTDGGMEGVLKDTDFLNVMVLVPEQERYERGVQLPAPFHSHLRSQCYSSIDRLQAHARMACL